MARYALVNCPPRIEVPPLNPLRSGDLLTVDARNKWLRLTAIFAFVTTGLARR